jgi:hypothetical protein
MLVKSEAVNVIPTEYRDINVKPHQNLLHIAQLAAY